MFVRGLHYRFPIYLLDNDWKTFLRPGKTTVHRNRVDLVGLQFCAFLPVSFLDTVNS